MKTEAFMSILLCMTLMVAQAQIIETTPYADGFSIPVELLFDHQDNMYVVNKAGTITVVNQHGNVQPAPLIDIRDRVSCAASEKGLLGMAWHPAFPDSAYLFLSYTNDTASVISRFRMLSSGGANADSEEVLMTIRQPFNNHNGGQIHFGPDGYLYIAMGDGGASGDPQNRAQNTQSLLGKMLRINVNQGLPYSIPEDNPFVDSTNYRPEIWALGLRNPWKFSFDQQTGDMYIGDVGQNRWEEVNYIAANSPFGKNFGWRCREGFDAFNTSGCGAAEGFEDPIHVYKNNETLEGCSITGGYVYRGQMSPALQGKYIYGDYCTGKAWALSRDENGAWQNELLLNVGPQELGTFGQDKDGEIYIGLLGSGRVLQLTTPCNLSFITTSLAATCDNSSDGQVFLTVNGANGPFAYDGPDLDSIAPGTYAFTITDSVGCVLESTLMVGSSQAMSFPMALNVFDSVFQCDTPAVFNYSSLVMDYDDFGIGLYKDGVVIDTAWEGLIQSYESGTYAVELTSGTCVSMLYPFMELSIDSLPHLRPRWEDAGEGMIRFFAQAGYESYEWIINDTLIVTTTDSFFIRPFAGIWPGFNGVQVIGTTAAGCTKDSQKIIPHVSTKDQHPDLFEIVYTADRSTAVLRKKSSISDVADVYIIDLSGKIMENISWSEEELRILLSDYPAGTYLANITVGNRSQTLKLVAF